MADRHQAVFILTGASRGIGLAIAHFLLRKQCNLVVVARSRPPLEQLSQQYPGQVEVLSGDLADLSLGAAAAERAVDSWSRIDGVVVNHGVLDPVKRIGDVEAAEWRAAFDINVFSAVALIKAALPALRKAGGRIIFTSSGAAVHAYSTWGSYGASKAVLNHLAQTLAVEEPDVTSISIRPGVVDTEMQREIRELHHAAMDKRDADKFLGLPASGGLLRPEQPGHVIARLALDAPKELSGRFLRRVEAAARLRQSANTDAAVGTTGPSPISRSHSDGSLCPYVGLCVSIAGWGGRCQGRSRCAAG